MGRIAFLDEATIGQIAAGEVVERPVSVVKELVENSIDAGATRVTVEVEEGGCGRIAVVDDGCGMDRDDAVLALQPHATSKIRSAQDVAHVRTLGFRGEALASIASISHVEMITRPRGAESGVRLVARGGSIIDMEEVGAPEGTSIAVQHLFFNSPVRRRYLRSPATELGYISDCVAQCAIAHPGIGFRLAHAGETVVHHAGPGTLQDALVAVFGTEAARQMLAVETGGEQCAATGFISRPSYTRGTRAWQWFFVNGRPIRSKVIAHAVEQGYHTLIPSGRFPVAVLLLRMDPSLVDANVHPAKSEVRFLSEGELHRFVSRAVKETLEAADLTPQVGTPGALQMAPPEPPSLAGLLGALFAAPGPQGAPASAPGAPAPTLPLEGADLALPEARAQIHNTYILAEGPEGLFIIDQHTAHERALFEQLMAGRADELMRPLPLTVPFVVSLSTREATALRDNMDALRGVGFALEPFGRDAFLVRSVPAALGRADPETVLRDTLEELMQERTPQSVQAQREKIASLVACRSAVKAGDHLTVPEMQAIVRSLYDLQSRFTCQHGRPTVILLTRDELEKRFHR